MIINDELETIKKLQQGYSISRFGDGEFRLINGKSIIYQDIDTQMSNKLINILSQKNLPTKLLVGIPPFYQNKESFFCPKRVTSKKVINYWRKYLRHRDSINVCKIMDDNKDYYSSFISRIESFSYNNNEYLNELSKIWSGRNVVLIMNEKKYNDIKNIMNNCINKEQILKIIFCLEKNAYSQYDSLLNQCSEFGKDTLFLIMAGPTATLLAHDLCIKNYQCIDIGSFFELYK